MDGRLEDSLCRSSVAAVVVQCRKPSRPCCVLLRRTPLHCAASCNNVQVCKFLVESGAAVFAMTYSDMQTAADKCEEMEEGYTQCSQFLYGMKQLDAHVLITAFVYPISLGYHLISVLIIWVFPDSSVGKEAACNAGDRGSVPGLGRSNGEEIGYPLQYSWASLVAQLVKNLSAVQETWVRSLGLGRSPGEGKGYPLQYSGLENSRDCVVRGVAESDTTELLSLIIWESILCWYIVLGIENRAALISNVNAAFVCVCVCLEATIVRDIFTNKRQ